MKVVRHNTASDFLDRAGAWLETAEAENNLILGIAAYFRSYIGQVRVEPYFLTLEDSGAIVGAALMTPPRRLLITTMPDTAVTTLADFMLAETVTVPGALGPKSETRVVCRLLDEQNRTTLPCKNERADLHLRNRRATETCTWTIETSNRQMTRRCFREWCVQFCLDARIEDETVYFKARLPQQDRRRVVVHLGER